MEFQSEPLVFFVNGKKIIEKNPQPEQLLLQYLRETLNLTGTKEGCNEGGCGACTVMISKYDRDNYSIRHFAVVACLLPLCSVHGMAVTTVEGIGNTKEKLHPVQERIAKAHGIQCGFCTPGFVMSMYALLRNKNVPSLNDIEKAFQGNLCRCTGYRPIIDGYKTFCKDFKMENGSCNGVKTCMMGEKCCKNGNNNLMKVEYHLFEKEKLSPYDPTQEVIFPPELKSSDSLDKQFLVFKGAKIIWYRPISLEQLLSIKSKHSDAQIVAGNTELGLELQINPNKMKHLIYVDKIPEMNFADATSDCIRFGSNLSLSDLEDFLRKETIEEESKASTNKALLKMLHWFAGTQIRNVATVVGNIITASPISDLNPILLVSGASLEIVNAKDKKMKTVPIDSKFFIGYRKTVLNENDIVLSIKIPRSRDNEYCLAYKQSRRRDDDITIVNMALNVTINQKNDQIEDFKIAYGGVGSQIVMPLSKEFISTLKKFDVSSLEEINKYLAKYFKVNLPFDAPGGEVPYRQTLVLSLLQKAFNEINSLMQAGTYTQNLVESEKPLTLKSLQLFDKTPDSQPAFDSVGRPTVVTSAYKQSTGEAIFVDDIPRFKNELVLSLVLSTKAHAKILNIDASEALKQEGVRGFFSAADIPPEKRHWGLIFQDENIFADGVVRHYGEVVGAVVADTKVQAQFASRLVKIEYEDLPAILTLEEAIEQNSFFIPKPSTLENGNVDKAFIESDHFIEGTFRTGKQEHFYLEPQSSIVVPKDSDEMEIFTATQWPEKIQKQAAEVLGLTQSKINVRVKRIGGGFGGKEIRCLLVALPCVVAANKLKRPVRCTLTRQEDMIITGTRNPILFKYKVSFTKEGYLTGLDVKVWLNAGCTMDYSCLVLERAMFHVQNAYNIPNIRVMGWTCKTNTVSNTAFRGFGSPQSMMIAEEAIRQVARYLNVDYVDLMEKNLYREGHLTHYNQPILNCNVERCFREVLLNSSYEQRKLAVDKFNMENENRKRGISVVPTVFGVGFVPVYLNQAGALILVYTDGSVLLSHGGVEIGQGLHTKMIQIASRILEIPVDLIHIQETATDKIPNATSTAASTATDLNGMAVLNASQIIKERIAPFKAKYPDKDWKFWVQQAYMNRVSLSATGYFKQTDIGYNPETNQGNAFYYFVFGAAVAEVEIDCLTGDHLVHRVDIVMDLGSSINPAVDIGQIEGAFMQGYGLYIMEEVLFRENGQQHTVGPSTYKIPSVNDIPREFNVSLLTDAPNPRAVCSSKAVGEPPLFMASVVFFALKEAIIAARRTQNLDANFEFHAPATSARIRMACNDKFTKEFDVKTTSSNTIRPWAFPV